MLPICFVKRRLSSLEEMQTEAMNLQTTNLTLEATITNMELANTDEKKGSDISSIRHSSRKKNLNSFHKVD
uniref:Uncharacterized protein n=1 Tax=Onchocerca volvulus TaxID=6282 RepID=A0A8R1XRT7_ONCVO